MALPELTDDDLDALRARMAPAERAIDAMAGHDRGGCTTVVAYDGWPGTGAVTVRAYRDGEESGEPVWRVWRGVDGSIDTKGVLTPAAEALIAAMQGADWPGVR